MDSRQVDEQDPTGHRPLGTSSTAIAGHFPNIDAWRGIAALLVLGYHVASETGVTGIVRQILGHGNSGVALFFLISGFLLYRPFVVRRADGRTASLTGFYRRRVLRIVPGYWFALTTLAIYPGLPLFAHHWPIFYSFTQVYASDTIFSGLGVAWTLCIEMTFYLVLPLYALLVSRRSAAFDFVLLLGSAALSLVVHQILQHAGREALSYALPGTWYLFAAGMGLAIVSTSSSWEALTSRDWFAPALLLAGVVGVGAIFMGTNVGSLSAVNPVYAPVALLLLASAVAGGRRIDGAFQWRPLSFLGDISYGIYLWHAPVVIKLAEHVHSALALGLISLALTLVLATFSHYVVERPFLRLKR